MKMTYGKEDYAAKLRNAEDAINIIRSGQRIFIGSSCGEPQYLVNALLLQKDRFTDLEILRLLSLEGSITSMFGDQTYGRNFSVKSIYQGAGRSQELTDSKRFLTPMDISLIPRLFKSRQLPIHVALIQLSPPDDFGWMSLGVSVDITMAAARAANLVIAQVNTKMPRVLGHSFIHVGEVDIIVEKDEELLTVFDFPEPESSNAIAKMVANLIENGSTFQLGLGHATSSILKALAEKNDLGVHTQYLTDGIMDLVNRGVITNRYKDLNEGKLVASNAIGSPELYRFIHNNAAVEFYPSDYVNNPRVIAQNNKMVSINMASAIDLTGNVAAEALPQNQFAGVTGLTNFVAGAIHSRGGKSIIVVPSTSKNNNTSRIVPQLDGGSTIISRTDVYHVISEYGAVNLFGKNLQERAIAMISIAHPDFRDRLFQQAKDAGLISQGLTLRDSCYGVYPAYLEEVKEHQGKSVMYRPVKPIDDRAIQEHFYSMDQKDVASRFFQQRNAFFRDNLEPMYQVDYVNNLTIIATVTEGNFYRVIGIGEYAVEPGKNVAEISFSVSSEWQGKGVAYAIISKLAAAAKENGIGGLVAYTSPQNHAMIRLFKRLPYKIKKFMADDFLNLSCRFDETE